MVKQRSLVLFENAIKSDETRRHYLYELDKFLEFVKIDDPDKLLKLKSMQLQELLENYLIYLKGRISPNSIPTKFCAIEPFFTMNDKVIDNKKLHKMFPAKIKRSGKDAYTTEDVQKMLSVAKTRRVRASLHFLASTGCRIGAITDLKMRNLSEMPQGCKAIVIYEGTVEEYTSFLTPEASKALDEYLNERRRDGEALNPESPVFRTIYKVGVQKSKPLSTNSIRLMLYRINKAIDSGRHKAGKNYNIQLAHGFRKRFNIILKLNNTINLSIAEKLMGHKGVFQLDGAYLPVTKEQLFAEFQKAIFDLTVDDTERKNVKIEKLQEEKSDTEKIKEQYKGDHLLVQEMQRLFGLSGHRLVMPGGDPDKMHFEKINPSDESNKEKSKWLIEQNLNLGN